MVTGANLEERIEAVMTNRTAKRLGREKILLASTGLLTVSAALVVAGLNAPTRAQSRSSTQSGAKGVPRFEVASIKPCESLQGMRGGLTLSRVDRLVVNKTGIAGRYDFHLEYMPDERTGGPPPPENADELGPSLFTSLQEQLGLKLEPARGSGDILVTDHVERPSEN
jgi:hypothetical protein